MHRSRRSRSIALATLVILVAVCGGCGEDEEPAPAPSQGWWYTGLWGTSATDVISLGFDFDARQPFVRRFDGADWTTTRLDVSDLVARYQDIFGEDKQPNFILWSGGGPADNLHLAGDFGVVYRDAPGGWERVYEDLRLTDWRGVWATDQEVFIVGLFGKVLHGAAGVYTLAEPVDVDLFDVWGAATDDVWAVGEAVLHFDGSAWSEAQLGVQAVFRAVDGTSTNDIYVAGEGGLILHFGGQSWDQDHQHPGGDIGDLHCFAGGEVVAVAPGTAASDVLLREGGTWQLMASLPGVVLDAVWGSSPSDIYVNGARERAGVVYHWDGAAWQELDTAAKRTASWSATAP